MEKTTEFSLKLLGLWVQIDVFEEGDDEFPSATHGGRLTEYNSDRDEVEWQMETTSVPVTVPKEGYRLEITYRDEEE